MSDLICRQAAIDLVRKMVPTMSTSDGSAPQDYEAKLIGDVLVDVIDRLKDLKPDKIEDVLAGNKE